MKKIIGIIIVVVLALWGLIAMNNQTNKTVEEPLPRNDLQETVAYVENIELEDGIYMINTGDSYLGWKGKTPATAHYGTVYLSQGELEINNSEMTGEIVFDMDTITSEIGLGLDDHLKNEDFFDTSKYPGSRISINSYLNNEIQGDLTIKDITQPVSLPVSLVQDNNTLSLKGAFELDRTLWGVEYNSSSILSDLGDRAINDLIEFEIELYFEKSNE